MEVREKQAEVDSITRDVQACLRVLKQLEEQPDGGVNDELGRALSRAYKSLRRARRKGSERVRRIADRCKIEATGRVAHDPYPAPLLVGELVAPKQPACESALTKPRACYVCKQDFRALHAFYHLLCPTCATDNWKRRTARANLTGRVALITGGRIKIGFQTALKLLRDGARVIVTSRFSMDAAERFSRENDFGDWSCRLQIHRLDLRNLPAVYAFADQLGKELPSLDILINNAAQTIRRQPDFYADLLAKERAGDLALPPATRRLLANAAPSEQSINGLATPYCDWPDDLAYNFAGTPRDARSINSWMLQASNIEPAELAEVMLVNAMTPFALCSRLESLMRRSAFPDRYIVNVSAMEGQFDRESKTSRHPHTNMAKAALNMLTRTDAERLVASGIYMNSVDTGWITDENPHPKRSKTREKGFVPPLDEIDGASRVYDPIVRGVGGERVSGQFLKDYRPTNW